MTDETETQRRLVKARRNLTLGALAAAVAGGAAHAAPVMSKTADAPGWVQLASGEGEGEGEGASHGEGEGEGEGEGGSAALPSETGLMRDLGFMEGRLRAGMALYKAGDLDAARTHMGHPIEEKYGAVAAPLAERGYDRLKSEIEALAAAAEGGAGMAEIKPLYDKAVTTIGAARDDAGPKHRLQGLVALTRIAGDEYSVATEGGALSNLHEYQDSWGFLQVVADEAEALAARDGKPGAVAAKMAKAVETTSTVYGDLQGDGDYAMDSSVIYAAAARMELALAGWK